MLRYLVDFSALFFAAMVGFKAASWVGLYVMVAFVALYGMYCYVDGMN